MSGHISSKQPLHFGTIRVKSRYFPGSPEQVSTAKGFIGLEDTQPGAGAITITMHGAGGVASGAPRGANWTRYMQSAVYQHGNSHDKTFSDLGPTVNALQSISYRFSAARPLDGVEQHGGGCGVRVVHRGVLVHARAVK